MAPTIKSILKPTKAVRRVTFKTECEIREFGSTDAESTVVDDYDRVATETSKPYDSNWIDYLSEAETDLNKTIRGEPQDVKKKCKKAKQSKNLNDSTLAHNGKSNSWTMSRIFNHAKSLNTPIRRATVILMKQKKERVLAMQKSEKLARKIKMCHGVLWTKPTALQEIRKDWRFSDEMESDGDVPADNELEQTSTGCERKKKFRTKYERFCREVEYRRLRKQQDQEALWKMDYKKNILSFIEKAKKGQDIRSIASKDDEEINPIEKLSLFAQMRTIFIKDNKRCPRKVDFKVKANIAHRLAQTDLDPKVRNAYEAVLQNYDTVLGLHFCYLFQHKQFKEFTDLERMFLLNE